MDGGKRGKLTWRCNGRDHLQVCNPAKFEVGPGTLQRIKAKLESRRKQPVMSSKESEIRRQLRRARTEAWVADLAPVIAELQAAGVTSPRGIAAALNEKGIPTASGDGEWQAVQVGRVLARLDAAAR